MAELFLVSESFSSHLLFGKNSNSCYLLYSYYYMFLYNDSKLNSTNVLKYQGFCKVTEIVKIIYRILPG